MKIESEKLLLDLMERTRLNINQVKKFNALSKELTYRFGHQSWNILECIEHLNLYGDFYIPEIEKAFESSDYFPDSRFKSGFLGNFFATQMLPRERLNKMRTFSNKNPISIALNKTTLERFIAQQEQLLVLLDKSKNLNLNKTKIPVSFSQRFKLKLGDTFRFLIYHNERHISQANKILDAVGDAKAI